MQEEIWLCFCNAVSHKPAKIKGRLSSDLKKHVVRLILHVFFQNIPAGKQYKFIVFDEFSPGTRLISNGLNVRRVLRVSIIIKKLYFCLYFEAVVNLQMFGGVTWHGEQNAGHHFHASGGGADLP